LIFASLPYEAGLERPDILVFYRSCLEQAGLHAP